MSDYLLQHGTRRTPQSEQLTADQVENSAGGFVWAVDEWTRLRRFLILGSEGGSYYANERDLTRENIQSVRQCIAADGIRMVEEIVAISDGGRAPKNDPALFALASAISLGDKETKRAAAEALPKVARIGTHLYHFVAFAETMRGWGRTMRWAVSNWYAKNPEQLAFQAVKYRQRDGWSHRDLLRLAHPKTSDATAASLFNWIVNRDDDEGRILAWGTDTQPLALVDAFESAQNSASAQETANLVRSTPGGLPREALLTEHLNDKDVWAALLETKMPINAMVRNLATMTRNGILDSKEHKALVLEALDNKEAISKSRIHPMAILVALKIYATGRGMRGQNTWKPLVDILDALDGAFYLAFDNVEPTGKAHLLALDVSGSMTGGMVAGAPLSPREASSAMALITLHAEKDVECVGFYAGQGGYARAGGGRYSYGRSDGLTPLPISRRQRLDDVVNMTARLPFGGTDCALPFLYAAAAKKDFDAFVIYTDSETWAGEIHPKQAFDAYRADGNAGAKSVVVGMVSNGFTIADPNDAGMMDVVGFDTAAPALIANFIAGRI
jgi:60 kDa SS-A/Ro ribonucleoprotein